METSFLEFIGIALAMVLVIEGLLYAVFPDTMRKMIAMALALPEKDLRNAGLVTAALGFLTLWFLAA